MTMRIGSVPYLNAKPQVEWFHSEDCDVDAHLTYAVPSQLAQALRADELETAIANALRDVRIQVEKRH